MYFSALKKGRLAWVLKTGGGARYLLMLLGKKGRKGKLAAANLRPSIGKGEGR